nr:MULTISPECIES: ATP-binding protein [Lactobacillus]
MQRFSTAIHHFMDPKTIDNSSFSSFEITFQQIAELAKKERVVLVIDEYPYLAQVYPPISSMLQSYIDREYAKTNMFLILCGSSISFMEYQVLGYKSPLYGRRTVQYKLKPFTLRGAEELLPNYSKKDVFVINSIVGGVPKYLNLISDRIPVMENIKATFLNPDSLLFEEPSNLLKQELREPATYNSIINAIASGASQMTRIASRAGLEAGGITPYLKSLIELGIISKKVPVTEMDKPKKKKTIYVIECH